MSNRESVNHATATTPEFSMCSRICVFSTEFWFCQYNLSINLSDTLPFFLAFFVFFFWDPRIGIWITCRNISSDLLQKTELYCSAENTEVLHQYAVWEFGENSFFLLSVCILCRHLHHNCWKCWSWRIFWGIPSTSFEHMHFLGGEEYVGEFLLSLISKHLVWAPSPQLKSNKSVASSTRRGSQLMFC